MKALATADWHIGQFKGPVENGVNLRSRDTIECLEFMVKKAQEEQVDLVCISGDIFHQEQIGPNRYSEEVIAAVRIIKKLAEVAKTVVVMRGTPNHDGSGIYRVLTEMTSHISNIVIVTTPQVLQTSEADIVCIPGFDKQAFRANYPGLSAEQENQVWTEYISNMVTGLRTQCRIDRPSILMAHYTVPGCNTESGQTVFFANFEPVIPREAIQAAEYDAVLLGHIHRPQQVFGLCNVFYSGAVNALNFNDEGQCRGFFIHEFSGKELIDSQFITTPYRNFMTIEWGTDEVAEYLRDGAMYLIEDKLPELVVDSIVRVKYSCTNEQRKALNIPVLQNDLYNIGAFYVADIEVGNMVDVTNRGLLSEESDPLLNLKKWLEEKQFKDIDKIIEMAEPIINEAMKQSTTAEVHGVFRPVSITVKNYRNYKEETFDFSDVSFCTINGANGAGKSSLFMDAIADCLFEETREGDNKAWIRGTEDARSGSIEFVFDIGENRFRVVRTRMKSGRPTLNLSKMNGAGDWQNLSKERVIDTQAEIEKVLGMDSMTFRSCALIMQDQYGLFLQAKKEERIAILGNLLGLGIYGIMEQEARKHLADSKRQLMAYKEAEKIKNDIVVSKGNPEEELQTVERNIAHLEKEKNELTDQKDGLEVTLAEYETLKTTREQAEQHFGELDKQRTDTGNDIASVKGIINSCDVILANSENVRKQAKEYEVAAKEADDLYANTVQYEAASKTLKELRAEEEHLQVLIHNNEIKNQQIMDKIHHLQKDCGEDIDKKLEELDLARSELQKVGLKHIEVAGIEKKIIERKNTVSKEVGIIKAQLQLVEAELEACQKQKAFLNNSGCPDVTAAKCRFLEKAKTDVERISDLEAQTIRLQTAISETEAALKNFVEAEETRITEIGYEPSEEQRLESRVFELKQYEEMKRLAESSKIEIARLEVQKEANDKNIISSRERLSEVKIKASVTTTMMDELSKSVTKYLEATERKSILRKYVDEEKQFPVYEERKANALERLEKIEARYREIDNKLVVAEADMLSAGLALQKFDPDLEKKISDLNIQIRNKAEAITDLQVTKGTLLQKVEDVDQMQDEIALLKCKIAKEAERVVRYDALKQAFSQDGVPHQIIRNIVPHITDTANNILGSMTGGAMGVEFVMERAVKGKDGDKATLDVLINEYGKTTLPYASKSGGEKVKASLAVILALAEIKTTAAGIQLGMLFIDEPPFLDDDGTQAYVDALETIRQRYPDVKIMAITHDDAMKARFCQSVTVVKTENGSKVIY